MTWRPVIEPDFGQERFLTEQPETMYREGNFARVNVMVGITADEFVSPIAGTRNKLFNVKKSFGNAEIFPRYSRELQLDDAFQ